MAMGDRSDIELTAGNKDRIAVEPWHGRVSIFVVDGSGSVEGEAHVVLAPPECDALIAAIGRALGRPPGGNAARIVNAIVADLSDRRGLRHEWDGIDDDIRAEIVAKWTRIVEDGMGAREQQ